MFLQLRLDKVVVAARYVYQTNFDQSEVSILLLVQQSIYYPSSYGQSICNLNLMPHPIILEPSCPVLGARQQQLSN